MAKDVKAYSAPELFAATPRLESLEEMLRRAAQDALTSIIHVAITRAYFFAGTSWCIDIKLSVEE